MRKLTGGLALFLTLSLVVLLGLRAWQSSLQPALSTLDTPFKAIQLIGGRVLYGKLDRAWTHYPVLHDIYVVQQQQDPRTQQVTSSLARLGQEKMVLNTEHIVLIQTVDPDSPVGKLIAQGEASAH